MFLAARPELLRVVFLEELGVGLPDIVIVQQAHDLQFCRRFAPFNFDYNAM
jgi:hypothetical protein